MGIEIIIALGSFLVTSVMKIISSKSEASAKLIDSAIRANKQENDQVKFLSSMDNKKSFAFTRRILALSVVGAIVVVPVLAPIFGVGVAHCAPTGESKDILWGVFSLKQDVLACESFAQVTILPWHSQMVALILGAYFGSKVSK